MAPAAVVACGYEVSFDPKLRNAIKSAQLSLPEDKKTFRTCVFFGSAAKGDDAKEYSDADLWAWAEMNKAAKHEGDAVVSEGEPIVLKLKTIYFAGVVLGDFEAPDGSTYLGKVFAPETCKLSVSKCRERVVQTPHKVPKMSFPKPLQLPGHAFIWVLPPKPEPVPVPAADVGEAETMKADVEVA